MGPNTRLALGLAALALVVPLGASAAEPAKPDSGCSITHNADDPMTELIRREKFDDSYFKALCPWLAANGLELTISSDSGVIAEQPFAWVSVRLLRTRSQVTGPRASQSTVLPERSDPPEVALREALDSALTALTGERDQHLRELAQRETMVVAGR
jgi:hypothetical protein